MAMPETVLEPQRDGEEEAKWLLEIHSRAIKKDEWSGQKTTVNRILQEEALR